MSFIKPTDKKSLRSLQEDIEDYVKRKVNIETGEIYLAHKDEEILSDDPHKVDETVEYEYNDVSHNQLTICLANKSLKELKILKLNSFQQFPIRIK